MGAEPVFLDDPDGKGYSQEIRFPLKMITSEGVTLGPGSEMRVMFVLLAVEGDLVYVGNSSGSPQVLFRLDTATGSYQNWDGANNGGFRDLFVKELWKDQPGMPDKAEAMAARNGKLYLTFRSYNFRRSDVNDWRVMNLEVHVAEQNRLPDAEWAAKSCRKCSHSPTHC